MTTLHTLIVLAGVLALILSFTFAKSPATAIVCAGFGAGAQITAAAVLVGSQKLDWLPISIMAALGLAAIVRTCFCWCAIEMERFGRDLSEVHQR